MLALGNGSGQLEPHSVLTRCQHIAKAGNAIDSRGGAGQGVESPCKPGIQRTARRHSDVTSAARAA